VSVEYHGGLGGAELRIRTAGPREEQDGDAPIVRYVWRSWRRSPRPGPRAPSPRSPPTPEWKKVIEAARKEGKVVVYNGAVGTPALPKALARLRGEVRHPHGAARSPRQRAA
jgi:hypothetical protein